MSAALSEVASLSLLGFDGLEERLEVSSTETIVITSLNNFNEECRAIFQRLGENLQKITLLIEVDQKIQFSNFLKIFFHFEADLAESLAKVVVIRWWYRQKLAPASFHPSDRINNIICSQGDVLDTGTSVIIDVLLNLGLPLARSWLIDWHLDVLVEV